MRDFGPHLAKCGRVRPMFGRTRAEVGRHRPKCGRGGPSSAPEFVQAAWPDVHRLWPRPRSKSARSRSKFARIRPKLPDIGETPQSAQIRVPWTDLGPARGQCLGCRTSANLGPAFGQASAAKPRRRWLPGRVGRSTRGSPANACFFHMAETPRGRPPPAGSRSRPATGDTRCRCAQPTWQMLGRSSERPLLRTSCLRVRITVCPQELLVTFTQNAAENSSRGGRRRRQRYTRELLEKYSRSVC